MKLPLNNEMNYLILHDSMCRTVSIKKWEKLIYIDISYSVTPVNSVSLRSFALVSYATEGLMLKAWNCIPSQLVKVSDGYWKLYCIIEVLIASQKCTPHYAQPVIGWGMHNIHNNCHCKWEVLIDKFRRIKMMYNTI